MEREPQQENNDVRHSCRNLIRKEITATFELQKKRALPSPLGIQLAI